MCPDCNSMSEEKWKNFCCCCWLLNTVVLRVHRFVSCRIRISFNFPLFSFGFHCWSVLETHPTEIVWKILHSSSTNSKKFYKFYRNFFQKLSVSGINILCCGNFASRKKKFQWLPWTLLNLVVPSEKYN